MRAGRCPAPSRATRSRKGRFDARRGRASQGPAGSVPPPRARPRAPAGPAGLVAVGGSIVKCLRGGFALPGARGRGAWEPGCPFPPPAPLRGHAPSAGTLPVPCSALRPQARPCVGHPLVVAVASPCPDRLCAHGRAAVRGFVSNPQTIYRLLSSAGLKCPSQSPLGQRSPLTYPFVLQGRQLNGLCANERF